MAKENENGFLSGHIGDQVFREMNGKQVVQAMPSHYRDRNSEAQQKQRSGMRNILVTYRLLKNALKEQFEEATALKRPYNCFIHHNILLPAVELSKENFDNGQCLMAEYVVSHGSLPSLDVQVVDGNLQFRMKADDWKPGDILRTINIEGKGLEICTSTGLSTGTSTEFSINTPSRLSASYTDEIINASCDRIMSVQILPNTAWAFIHIRKTRKGTLVSTQHLVMV